ncbi:MAG: glycosyltransferase, partial [Bacteroidales bacterium]|nr:glycosyltransferase [Bacteroidales bacterium]
MKLSIVIVNYNVKHFLEQCLNSVFNALKEIEAEVFVVDNNSVDGSCAMIEEKFKDVKLIANKTNYGFSVANNQAIKQAKGDYILLLNPDTVVQEDTFTKVVAFMDSHDDAGGLGVKMIDGKGKFLPESKRALPTPAVAFYKIFGLAKLFPKSKRFGQYHLTYLDKNKTNKVEVLSGAFMLLRKSLIDKIGALDEEYFMYGEDIDLSYRITQAGYENYYYPETTIIHYKGESTKKGSINYVLVFYRAMIIFARKHFSEKNAKLFSFLINSAVYFRASLAIIHRFLIRILPALLDAAIIFAIFMLLIPIWGLHKFGEVESFPKELLQFAIPSYITTWIISLIFTGGYDRPLKIVNVLKGIVLGSAIILLFYSLLPEYLRFSRAVILLGTAASFIMVPIGRLLLHATNIKQFRLNIAKSSKTIIVGKKDEIQRVLELIGKTTLTNEISGYVNSEIDKNDSFFLGNISQLSEIVQIHKINEI